ncbi:MAG: hypothetical protein IPM96_12530 [Ignavibacteria bacterium]|nr:hypothetical protein [Ignavibacteria bacterium]
MKKQSIFLITFLLASATLVFSFSISNSAHEASNQNINISIKTSKSSYLESEPVWVEYFVRIVKGKINLDFKPQLDPGADIKLILLNSKNDTMNYVGGRGSYLGTKNYPDTLWGIINLLHSFGNPEKFPHSVFGRIFYLPEDNYQLEVLLHYYVNGKVESVTSNKVTFSIMKPSGEELEAHEKFLNLYEQFGNGCSYDKIKLIVTEFDNQYNNSVYLDRMKYALLSMSFIEPNFTAYAEQFLIDAIDSNPNSYYNFNYIRTLKEYVNQNTEFENTLKILSGNSKNTITNTIIDHEIKGHIK